MIDSAALILSANTYTPRATYLISVQDPINFPAYNGKARIALLWDLVKNESANLSNVIFSDNVLPGTSSYNRAQLHWMGAVFFCATPPLNRKPINGASGAANGAEGILLYFVIQISLATIWGNVTLSINVVDRNCYFLLTVNDGYYAHQ